MDDASSQKENRKKKRKRTTKCKESGGNEKGKRNKWQRMDEDDAGGVKEVWIRNMIKRRKR